LEAKKVFVGGIALAIVTCAALLFVNQDPDVEVIAATDPDAATTPEVAPATSKSAEDVDKEAAPQPELRREEVEVVAPPTTKKMATVRGRCVDVDGSPLAGCKIGLHGWGANSERTDAWLLDHGKEPEWEDPEDIETGSDGRFEFRFWPPPPFQFSLDLGKPGYGPMSARWHELAIGKTRDVGDVTMQPGVEVSGRVTTDKGAPVAKTYVSVNFADHDSFSDGVGPRWGGQVRTDDNGRFKMRRPFAPGKYQLSVRQMELVEPKFMTLEASKPTVDLKVIVKEKDRGLLITGKVIDETGQPVANVRIQALDDVRGYGGSTSSKRDGTFELANYNKSGGTTKLHIQGGGCEAIGKPPEMKWGTKDVVIRVRLGGSLTVRVTNEQHEPVVNYQVRLVPVNRNSSSSRDRRVRGKGEHEDGTIVIPGLTSGDWLLVIDFDKASGFQSILEQFTRPDSSPLRLDLIAIKGLARTIRVLTHDNKPVQGSKVRLLELFGKPLDPNRIIMDRRTWMWNIGNLNALVLDAETTDADGRVTVRGLVSNSLGLSVGEGGHVPLQVDPVVLGVDEELIVKVSRGATLTGVAGPKEALQELRRAGNVKQGADFSDDRAPKLTLRRTDGQSFPAGHSYVKDKKTPLLLGADGSFSGSGIPTGTWKIHLTYWTSSNGMSMPQDIEVGSVTLADGSTQNIALDLSVILPGTLSAVVQHNGEPAKNTRVYLVGSGQYVNATTDDQGALEVDCRAGEYQLRLQNGVHALSKAVVRRDQKVQHTFQVFSGTIELTIVDDKGQPISNVQVGTKPAIHARPTDAAGKVKFVAPAALVEFSALPKRYMSQEARRKLWDEGRANGIKNPLDAVMVKLGQHVVQAGEAKQLRLQVPPEWHK